MGPSLPLAAFLIALSLALGVVAVGLLLYRVGRRGRRVDDHPLCRQCRFDLTGAPPTSERCPECGADVSPANPRAITIGNRTRGPLWIAAGLLLIFVGSVGTVGVCLSLGPRVDWQAVKPNAWLLREARSSDRSTRETALDALASRDGNDASNPASRSLDAADQQALIARVLEVQAEVSLPWKPFWGDVVARRIEAGTLPATQRDAFFKATFASANLRVRQEVRQGDPLPMNLVIGGRGPGRSLLAVRFSSIDEQTFIDGQPIGDPDPTQRGGGYSQMSLGNSPIRVWRREEGSWLKGLPLGTRTAEYRTLARVRANHNADASVIATIPIAATATFTMVPAGAETVVWVDDEALHVQIARALGNCSVQLNGTDEKGTVRIAVGIPPLPVAVASQVTARQGSRTWKIGTFATTATQTSSHIGTSLKGMVPGKADLVFTSDTSAAAGTVDVVRAWRGEIVIPNVPVIGPPSTGPSR